VFSKVYLNDTDPDAQTMAQASWYHNELMDVISFAVQKGTAKAFSGK
jgi:hypothetical protein